MHVPALIACREDVEGWGEESDEAENRRDKFVYFLLVYGLGFDHAWEFYLQLDNCAILIEKLPKIGSIIFNLGDRLLIFIRSKYPNFPNIQNGLVSRISETIDNSLVLYSEFASTTTNLLPHTHYLHSLYTSKHALDSHILINRVNIAYGCADSLCASLNNDL